MNLNQLKIFFLVIRRGSLTAAAAELNITQPAVTKAIQRLQEYYDVRLVERSGRKWVLTAPGKALYRIADRIFNLEIQAENCIRGFQAQGERRLRISASETFGGYYLPEVINRYQRRHPDITVSVDILPNEKVVERTASLDNDVGFISCPIRHKSLRLHEVFAERLVLIVAAGHPLARVRSLKTEALKKQPIIMHEQGSAVQKAMDELLGRQRTSLSHYLEFSNNEAIKRAVAAGTGIALISEKVVAEEIRDGKLEALRLSRPPIQRAFYMLHHKGQSISRPLQELIEVVEQWAAETAAAQPSRRHPAK
jgi:DNA-binding transcriptional LysR family regulator